MVHHPARLFRATLCLVALLLLVSGCDSTGKAIRQTQVVRAGRAQKAAVDIQMGAGRLLVEGGARNLMEAEFQTSYAQWEPRISYQVEETQGSLLVEQPPMQSRIRAENIVNQWDIRLNDEIPMDLRVELGAGQSDLDLTGMSLTNLAIEVGAAEIAVDLRGNWDRDIEVTMHGGVGKILILLPDKVGVRADVRGGIGTIATEGLAREGSRWVNDAYGNSDVTLNLDVEGGIGEIRLEVAGR